jgi:hypothetical protein
VGLRCRILHLGGGLRGGRPAAAIILLKTQEKELKIREEMEL